MAKNFLNSKTEIFSKYLRLDLAYFIGGGFWLGLSTIVITIGGIFLSALFARLLAKDVFGQYSFLISILGFAGLLALPGMTQAVTQAAAEGKDGFLKKAIMVTAKWSTFGGTVLVFVSGYYYFNNQQNLSFAIFLSALAFPISAAGNLYNAFLIGKKRFRLVALYGTLAQFASITGTTVALFLFPSLIMVALFSAWSTAIVNVILTLLTMKWIKNDESDQKLIHLGYHLSLSQVFTITADYLDRFLIPIFLGFANNAIYSFAILIPMQIHGFLKVFTMLGQPKVADLSSKNLKRGFVVKSLQLEIVIAVGVLTYILAAPTIFKILYPNYQGEAVMLSQIFSLSLLYFPGNILSLLFIKERHPSAIHKTNIIYGLTTAVSLIILVPTLGLVGAVLAKVTARFAQLGIQAYLFAKSRE